jgi:phage shock protein E
MKWLLFIFCLAGQSLAAHAQSGIYRDLSPAEFKSTLDSLPTAILLDFRTIDEMKGGIIPNAKQLDYFSKQYEDQIEQLDRSKVYFLYCAGGGRSGEAKELMQQKGFARVYNLEGGFTAWKKAKMPVITPQGD